jgi:hypothetical protein
MLIESKGAWIDVLAGRFDILGRLDNSAQMNVCVPGRGLTLDIDPES